MKKVGVVVVLFVFLFAISSYADVDTGYSCAMDCQTLSQNGDQYYCNQATQTCFLIDSGETETTYTAETTTASTGLLALTTEQKIAALEESISALQTNLQEVSSGVSLSNQDISAIKNQLASMQIELSSLKGNIETDLNEQTNSFSTGLAGLQEGVNKTQQTLEEVQRQLDKGPLGTFFTTLLVLLIIGAVGGGIYYYMTRMQPNSGSNNSIRNYINDSIKQGKKLPQIKQELARAGWSSRDIEENYNDIARQNYRQYKSSQPERTYTQRPRQYSTARNSSTFSSLSENPKKMIAIAAVSVLVIIMVVLVLRGVSTGEAIFFKKLIGGSENGTSGENTYTVECTPPHLLNPVGDGCCLDSDASGICDTIELQGPGLGVGGQCNDNRECSPGLYCVSNSCSSLDSLYTRQGDCSKLCSYYALKILTSDGESYDLKPKQGSYTAAGALEWKILAMPQYCKGEPAIVPINIIKKKTGEIITEEVIVLHEGENSNVLTHPTIPSVAFTLTVADVFESCPE